MRRHTLCVVEPRTPAPALAVERLVKAYGPVHALAGVTLDVAAGCCMALVGESGAGKSTVLRCINRIEEADAGRVLIGGEDVSRSDPVELRRSIGYVPQEGGLLPHWRVGRNVELVLRLRGAPDVAEAADAALRLVALDPAVYRERWPHQLSGGQRQRVAIARALAARPTVLLLDEPFGALDAITRGELQEAFAALLAGGGPDGPAFTAVLVTHDVHEAFVLADRVVVLRRGAVEQSAPPAEILAHPATPYVETLLARARLTRDAAVPLMAVRQERR